MGFKQLLSAPFQKIKPVAARWKPKPRHHVSAETIAVKPPRLREASIRGLSAAWCGLEQCEPSGPLAVNAAARAVIERIKWEARTAGHSNLTRAEAYRELYFRRPELHGALLGHVMTRNIGYYMSDLFGELLPRLLDEQERKQRVMLLDRLDAAMFRHSYPQYLLYEAGKKEGRELTELLPFFGVSRFMQPVWNLFWQKLDRSILTTALIVSEQHVVSQQFAEAVFEPLLNEAFSIIMPYGASVDGGLKLAGLTIKNLNDLDARIEAIKRLYVSLFGIADVHEGVHSFVRGVPHSGSRADYAPELFTASKTAVTFGRYKQKLNGCTLIHGHRPLYSPKLADCSGAVQQVEEQEQSARETGGSASKERDWFVGADPICGYFRRLPAPERSEVFQEHCSRFKTLELAVQAAERLRNRTRTT